MKTFIVIILFRYIIILNKNLCCNKNISCRSIDKNMSRLGIFTFVNNLKNSYYKFLKIYIKGSNNISRQNCMIKTNLKSFFIRI